MAKCKSCHWQTSYDARLKCDTPEKRAARSKASAIRKFGKTKEWYDAEYAKGCRICKRPFGKSVAGRAGIDHDHACCPGKTSCGSCVRGLLCGNCNLMLGLCGDSITILAAAIDYLVDPGEVQSGCTESVGAGSATG